MTGLSSSAESTTWVSTPGHLIKSSKAFRRCTTRPTRLDAKTLAVTIPELSLPVKEEERDTLNSLIGQYVKEHESTTLLLDLHKEMPYHSADPAFRDRVWCGDGLHPSAEGYDFLAEKVWQVLKPQLEGSLS